jgi:hypothetical protein
VISATKIKTLSILEILRVPSISSASDPGKAGGALVGGTYPQISAANSTIAGGIIKFGQFRIITDQLYK